MLYLRYAVGGQAELSAAEFVSLDDILNAHEGPIITPEMGRVVQEYLIDAMREMKIDEASIAGVTCLSAWVKQAKGLA